MSTSETTFRVLFARLTWMLLGPMALFLLLSSIATRGGGWLTPPDLGYLAVLAVMIGGRWLEYRSGHAQTASGEPATADHFRRYVVGASAVGLAVWVVCAVAAYQRAPSLGRRNWVWGLIGLFTGPFGLFALYLLPRPGRRR